MFTMHILMERRSRKGNHTALNGVVIVFPIDSVPPAYLPFSLWDQAGHRPSGARR